jgi:hypothetical protein
MLCTFPFFTTVVFAQYVFYFAIERLYSYGDSSRFTRDSLLIPTYESRKPFFCGEGMVNVLSNCTIEADKRYSDEELPTYMYGTQCGIEAAL